MMSIKTKFGITLGAVLTLHVFTAIMGHIGLEKAKSDVRAREQVNAETLRILSLDHTIVELQRAVTLFMLTGNASSADRVRELELQVQSEIEAATSSTTREEAVAVLTSMSERMRIYSDDFEKVVVDRHRRGRLLEEVMFPTSEKVLASLEAIQERSDESAATAKLVANSLLRGEGAALYYFDSPNGEQVDTALAHMRRAHTLAQDLPAGESTEDLAAAIHSYELAFLDAVQATRGYLHLVNVVLAGESSELLHDSSGVRTASLELRDALSAEMRSESARFQLLSNGIAVITVLAGLMATGLMTRSVLGPIFRMTETLRKLSAGDDTAAIEGTTRGDEIGAMAKAAEIFRQKNIQTEKLLNDSRRMGEDLERRNSEMTQFVYTVSHDLKSPLVTVQGFAGMLEDVVHQGDVNEIHDITQRIIRGSERMSRTLDDLLHLSRIGVVIGDTQPVNLQQVCEQVIADLESDIQRIGAHIDISGASPVIDTDPTRMQQVVQNLVHNAIKYGIPEHGSPRIAISLGEADGRVRLTVSDNGPGIDPKYADRIFGVFQQLHSKSAGSGVGLAIVKKIADAHGGRVWLAPSDIGATFHFELPMRPADVASAA